MNAWRDALPRVLRELWLAVFTHDTAQVRRTIWRVLGRIGLHKPVGPMAEVHRAAWACACVLMLIACYLAFIVSVLGMYGYEVLP
jgi:hypothetical protein